MPERRAPEGRSLSGAGVFWRRRAVLVTGGGGFIGSHLVDALCERGAKVRVLDNFSTGQRENLHGRRGEIEVVDGDLRSRDDCRRAVAGTEVVFHQAALGSVPRSMEDPATSLEVNVTGTANLFAAARDAGVRSLVFASSSSVYGNDTRLPKREGQEGKPLSPYALSKVMNEQLADVFCRCFAMSFVGLRYFNVFGPRQNPEGPYAAVIPRFFQAYARNEAPTIFGDGEQSRDFTFVADAVQANLRAAEALMARDPRTAVSRVYNVGGGATCSVNRLAEAVRREVGGGPDPEHAPSRAGDVRSSLADLTSIHSEIGYEPRHSLEDGLRRTRDFYLDGQRPGLAADRKAKG